MQPEELQWLAEQAKKHKMIAEVGSYLGRSTRALGDNTDGVVHAYDDWKGPKEQWWIDATPEEKRLTLWEKFNENLADLIASGKVVPHKHDHSSVSLNSQVDMAFIDGDHSYASVKRDIELWRVNISPGGTLCGHDLDLVYVRQAVKDCLVSYFNPAGYIWAVTI